MFQSGAQNDIFKMEIFLLMVVMLYIQIINQFESSLCCEVLHQTKKNPKKTPFLFFRFLLV